MLSDSDLYKRYLPSTNSSPYTTVYGYLQERPESVFNTTEAVLERIDAKGFYFLAPFGEVAKLEQAGCTYARVGEGMIFAECGYLAFCDFTYVHNRLVGFWEYQYGLPFQLESKYTAVFSDAISSLRDDGTLQELEAKWFTFR